MPKRRQALDNTVPTSSPCGSNHPKLGGYFYHDDLQALNNAEDESAVAEGDENTSASGSDESDAGDDEAAVADDADKPSVVGGDRT